MNTKERNNQLMALADKAIKETKVLFKDENSTDIQDSYNGQIAALGVAIAMSGLRPALANYYQDKPEKRKVKRRNVLTVISCMIKNDTDYDCANKNNTFDRAKSFFEYSLRNDVDLNKLKKEVTDCAIALKQVVRTYNLV